MRIVKLLACLALLLAPLAAHGGDKPKSQSQIEAARAAIEAFTRKADDNKLVTGDLESARTLLKKGEDALANGRAMFGLGDVTPEAAQEIKFATDMVDLHLALGQSRIDHAKAAEELAVMGGLVAKMKAKVKVFDDRKAELEKLRASLVKFDATTRELGEVKAENARLIEKTGKMELDRKATLSELERLKTELAKRDLPAAAAAAPTVAAAVGSAVTTPAAPAGVPAVTAARVPSATPAVAPSLIPAAEPALKK
jgi:hypothetical protein